MSLISFWKGRIVGPPPLHFPGLFRCHPTELIRKPNRLCLEPFAAAMRGSLQTRSCLFRQFNELCLVTLTYA